MKNYHFSNHQSYVAACEQLADDLVSFHANSMDFIIAVKDDAIESEITLEWLNDVAEVH